MAIVAARPLAAIGAIVLTALVAVPVAAQTHVATVASSAGTFEVQRSGSGDWQPAMIGTLVFLLDNVRTGPSSAGTLVFVDDAVVTLGPGTELSLDRYGAAAKSKGPPRALLKLAGGKIEAIVSGYGEDATRFEIETPTAVARVQSTQFAVLHDAREKVTEVIGVEGVVAVQGRTGLIGPGVAVGPGEFTRVQQGRFPTPVEVVDAAARAAAFEGLGLAGTGSREGLDVDNPIIEGRTVAPEDRPDNDAAQASASFLRPGVPGETLAGRLSPDVRANTQPLPVYRAVPPIDSPNPPH
jgi:hypothetical protein